MAFKDVKSGDILYAVYSDADRDPTLGIEKLEVLGTEKYKTGLCITYRSNYTKYNLNSFFVPNFALGFSQVSRFYINLYNAKLGLKLKCAAVKSRINTILKQHGLKY